MKAESNLHIKSLLATTAIALAVNSIAYFAANSVGATWDVGFPFKLPFVAIVVATALPMLAGGLIVRAVAKKRPSLVNWAAWGVLTFSIAGSPGGWIASQDAATGLALGSMHAVVGLAWFVWLKSSDSKRSA